MPLYIKTPKYSTHDYSSTSLATAPIARRPDNCSQPFSFPACIMQRRDSRPAALSAHYCAAVGGDYPLNSNKSLSGAARRAFGSFFGTGPLSAPRAIPIDSETFRRARRALFRAAFQKFSRRGQLRPPGRFCADISRNFSSANHLLRGA